VDTETRRPWTVVDSSAVHENPHYSVLRQDVLVDDGSHRDYFTIHFPRPAVGVVVRRGTDFRLLRQYRFIVDEFVWAIPSGGVADNESLEEAAARELEEETGYRAMRLAPFMTCYASYGCSDQRFEIFLADDVTPASGAFDTSEVLAVRWFSRDEVLGLVRSNAIVDNLSLSPVLQALLLDVCP
jgi:8-oxo-dGTP pyrophosphatase MutT (NUDIX family)